MGLVENVIANITASTVVSAFRSIELVRMRIESGLRAKGRDASLWIDALEEIVEAVERHTRQVLVVDFAQVAESAELWDLLSGQGFAGDLFEQLAKEIVGGSSSANGCVEGPRIYQVSRDQFR